MILTLPLEAEVLGKLIAWGNSRAAVRALIMTSSRARPGGPVDLLSDYDIIIAAEDAERWGSEDDWLSDYGEPMVRWGDESEMYGLTTYFRGVVYTDYVKIDYTVWPDALLERMAGEDTLPEELDEGYRVLLDKEDRTSVWKPPSHRAFIPARPTEAQYRALVEEFWWNVTYVAKSLWRDELVFARFVLDHEIRLDVTRRLLEWRIEMDHDWSMRPGVFGRGLKRLLPDDIWSELTSGYVVGPEIDENWDALLRAAALFRRVAAEVGGALGYEYPQQVDDRVSAYMKAVRNLPRSA